MQGRSFSRLVSGSRLPSASRNRRVRFRTGTVPKSRPFGSYRNASTPAPASTREPRTVAGLEVAGRALVATPGTSWVWYGPNLTRTGGGRQGARRDGPVRRLATEQVRHSFAVGLRLAGTHVADNRAPVGNMRDLRR